MTRKPKITFVGPIGYQRKKNKRGGAGAEFVIVQEGGALKLEYPSMEEGQSARRALLADHHSHSVPTNKLLSAIQEALQRAQGDSPQDQSPAPEEVSQMQDNDAL